MELGILTGRSAFQHSLWASMACLSALYLLLPRLPRGLPRLLCVLPSFPVLARVPFCTRPHFLRSFLSFMFLWVAPTKLLLRCWDIPADYPSDGFLYFIATTVMPLRVKGKLGCGGGRRLSLMRRFQDALSMPLLHFLFFFVALNVLWRLSLSIWVEYGIYCLLIFLGMEGVLGLFTGLTGFLLRLELYPYFDNPFMSSTLVEFWGRRWNCLVSFMLRETVYNPILKFLSTERRNVVPVTHSITMKTTDGSRQMHLMPNSALSASLPTSGTCRTDSDAGLQENSATNVEVIGKNAGKVPLFARAAAMFASFVVSGLFHELIYYCLTHTNPTWEATMFFILHGVATVFQVFVRRKFPDRRKLPKPIAVVCTLAFIYFSALWLFVPPVIRSGAVSRILAEFRLAQDRVVDILSR